MTIGKKEKYLWGALLLLLWSGIGLLLYRSSGSLTVQELLQYQPENRLLAALVMCGLFLLKSVDFLLHFSVLFAMSGVMYSLPLALLVNTLGILILSVVPYWIGRRLGAPLLSQLCEKHPRLRNAEELGIKSEILLNVLIRLTGIPVNMASLYMGARRFSFGKYLLASVLGNLPMMIPYTLMGLNADNPKSPVFIWSIVWELLLSVGAITAYAFLLKRNVHIVRKDV